MPHGYPIPADFSRLKDEVVEQFEFDEEGYVRINIDKNLIHEASEDEYDTTPFEEIYTFVEQIARNHGKKTGEMHTDFNRQKNFWEIDIETY